MAVHIHPVKIPPRYYKPIGRIAAGWNLTEALVASIIWHLHGIKRPEMGRLFTYRLNATQKIKILGISLQSSAHSAQLKTLLTRVSNMKSMRNDICHGLWGRMPKQKIWKLFYSKDIDDMPLLRRKELTPPQITKIADDLDQLNRDIKSWMAQNRVPPP